MAICEPTSDLLSREEAARFLRVKPQTLGVWACTRRYAIPYVKIGARVFYRRADLEAFIDRRTVGGDPQAQ